MEQEETPNTIRVPEPRYPCAGEYCPRPGHAHTPGELFLHTSVMWPSFFCSSCQPAPMDLGNPQPEPVTLSQYLELEQHDRLPEADDPPQRPALF